MPPDKKPSQVELASQVRSGEPLHPEMQTPSTLVLGALTVDQAALPKLLARHWLRVQEVPVIGPHWPVGLQAR